MKKRDLFLIKQQIKFEVDLYTLQLRRDKLTPAEKIKSQIMLAENVVIFDELEEILKSFENSKAMIDAFHAGTFDKEYNSITGSHELLTPEDEDYSDIYQSILYEFEQINQISQQLLDYCRVYPLIRKAQSEGFHKFFGNGLVILDENGRHKATPQELNDSKDKEHEQNKQLGFKIENLLPNISLIIKIANEKGNLNRISNIIETGFDVQLTEN